MPRKCANRVERRICNGGEPTAQFNKRSALNVADELANDAVEERRLVGRYGRRLPDKKIGDTPENGDPLRIGSTMQSGFNLIDNGNGAGHSALESGACDYPFLDNRQPG